ncbi:MAG: M4 family metallopeptidase [Legionellaceae bacterium]|nr:M4 family metallopeptidase [Legionellaceae bacterium]
MRLFVKMLCTLATVSSFAGQLVDLKRLSWSDLTEHWEGLAPGSQAKNIISPRTLQLVGEHQDSQHIRHIRFQQRYQGYLVHGGYVILHTPSTLEAFSQHAPKSFFLTGSLFENLAPDFKTAKPNKAEAQAVLDSYRKKYAQDKILHASIHPLVYMDEQQQAHWAYEVRLSVESSSQGLPQKPRAIIETETRAVLIDWDDIQTERVAVQGMGFGGNEKTGCFHYGNTLPWLSLQRDTVSQQCYVQNESTQVIDVRASQNAVMHFPCIQALDANMSQFWMGVNRDGYDIANGGYSPTNDVLYAGQRITKFFQDWYGISPLQVNGHAQPLIMRVHYGFEYQNAFWDGKGVNFGDGGALLYPLTSLEIASHEVGHGITAQHSKLVYYGQSGGLNESFSDILSKAVEYYEKGTVVWNIGSSVIKASSGIPAFRYMDVPSRDGSSIERVDQFKNSRMDVHDSSGVFNRFFYLLSTSEGWNVHLAFNAVLKAQQDYWFSYTQFVPGGCGIWAAARDLHYSLVAVEAALSNIGINPAICKI